MAILTKDGTEFAPSAAGARIIEVLRQASTQLGRDFTITAGTNGQHAVASRHYVGEAYDVRTKDQTPLQVSDLAALLKRLLGPRFTVLHEDPNGPNQHLHIQPLKGSTYAWRDFISGK